MRTTRPYAWGKSTTQKLLQIDFIRFGIVGFIGFIVTFAFKSVVFRGFEVYVATFLGSEVGMVSNFIFHEKWTYNNVDHHSKSVWKKLFHFQLSSLSGVILLTINSGSLAKYLHLSSLLSLAIAAGITMFWNYFWTKFFIFKGSTPAALLDPEDTVPLKN